MSDDSAFSELLNRVHGGDQDAAGELVRRYESAIRRAVRLKLTNSRLKGTLDSMDICQSVMGSFFYRAALGQYKLEKPEDLVRLLVTMARNKLTDQVRRHTTDRRGKGMTRQVDVATMDVPGGDPTASRVASARRSPRRRLGPPQPRRALDRRTAQPADHGPSWPLRPV